MARMSPQELNDIFSFHPATEQTGPVHDEVREMCRVLAEWFNDKLPDSREKSLAITKVQEAMMFANASVAIHGPGTLE